MRLSAFIAKSGFSSRRKAAFLVKSGKVKLNGKVTLEPWIEIKESDSVKVSGKNLKPEKNAYIIFNKPKGVTTTLKDAHAEMKISDFIPKKFGRLYPVGRLDRNSTGLIILTNDGDTCYKLTHPKFEVEKEYILWVKGRLDEALLEKAKKGIRDDGDTLRVKYASIKTQKKYKTEINAVISEGKKRHLRRLFKALGYPVINLKRIRIGRLKLGTLREGTFKLISKSTLF